MTTKTISYFSVFLFFEKNNTFFFHELAFHQAVYRSRLFRPCCFCFELNNVKNR